MTMQVEHQGGGDDDNQMGLSSAATTIDPSVVQSRIRQSASLQREDAGMQDNGDPTQEQPVFPKLSAAEASGNKIEYRRVRCPPHRYTPLRDHWEQILSPLVEYLKLQVRLQEERKRDPPFALFNGESLPRGAEQCRGRRCSYIRRNVHCVVLGIYKPSGKPQWYSERNGAAHLFNVAV